MEAAYQAIWEVYDATTTARKAQNSSTFASGKKLMHIVINPEQSKAGRSDDTSEVYGYMRYYRKVGSCLNN
jgi:hypothetical protein